MGAQDQTNKGKVQKKQSASLSIQEDTAALALTVKDGKDRPETGVLLPSSKHSRASDPAGSGDTGFAASDSPGTPVEIPVENGNPNRKRLTNAEKSGLSTKEPDKPEVAVRHGEQRQKGTTQPLADTPVREAVQRKAQSHPPLESRARLREEPWRASPHEQRGDNPREPGTPTPPQRKDPRKIAIRTDYHERGTTPRRFSADTAVTQPDSPGKKTTPREHQELREVKTTRQSRNLYVQ